MSDRRTFLRGLATLPLIGGSVALIGKPTAAAVPVTEDLLYSYNQWLFYERRLLCVEQFGMRGGKGSSMMESFVPHCDDNFHFPDHPTKWTDVPKPSTRAAIVMATVGASTSEMASLQHHASISFLRKYSTVPAFSAT